MRRFGLKTGVDFWSGIGYGFRGHYGSVRTYLLFQFQMSKNEKEICQFEWVLRNIFWDVTKTGNGERGAGNGERKSGNELSAETSIKI